MTSDQVWKKAKRVRRREMRLNDGSTYGIWDWFIHSCGRCKVTVQAIEFGFDLVEFVVPAIDCIDCIDCSRWWSELKSNHCLPGPCFILDLATEILTDSGEFRFQIIQLDKEKTWLQCLSALVLECCSLKLRVWNFYLFRHVFLLRFELIDGVVDITLPDFIVLKLLIVLLGDRTLQLIKWKISWENAVNCRVPIEIGPLTMLIRWLTLSFEVCNSLRNVWSFPRVSCLFRSLSS